LPFSNEGFAASPGRAVNVRFMSTTGSLADPLVSSIASVLRVPLVELYALLWRVGVVEIRQTRGVELNEAHPAVRRRATG
jgi:hypothetical protein